MLSVWYIIINSTHSTGQQSSRTSSSCMTEPVHLLNSNSICRSPPVCGSHSSTSYFYEFDCFSYLIKRRQWHHSSTLAWKIPWTEEPGGLQSMGSRVRHNWATSLSHIEEGSGNPLQCSCLENPMDGEPGGLPSMGSHRVGHDWSNLAAAAAATLWYKWNHAPFVFLYLAYFT